MNLNKILHSPYLPTQVIFLPENSFFDEIKKVKSFIKDDFIEKNKTYLDENKYSVRLNGFIEDDKQVLFQICLIDENNEDVTVKSLSNLK